MQFCQLFILLHCTNLDPIGEVMSRWLLSAFTPDFRFKDFNVDRSTGIFQVILENFTVQFLYMLVLFVVVLVILDKTTRFYELVVSTIYG